MQKVPILIVLPLLVLIQLSQSFSFINTHSLRTISNSLNSNTKPGALHLSSPSIEEFEDDDEEIEPGKMRVSEIKAELKLRNVYFSDCFDKESLTNRLIEARASGKSDPSLLDEFNKRKLEANMEGQSMSDSIKDEDIEKVVGGDGNLPGGMSPEMLKDLLGNPELVVLLQNVKMQEVMKLTMSGGQEALQEAMEKDPETRELVMKLNQIMGSAMQ